MTTFCHMNLKFPMFLHMSGKFYQILISLYQMRSITSLKCLPAEPNGIFTIAVEIQASSTATTNCISKLDHMKTTRFIQ